MALKRASFCGRVALERTSCLQQMFKMMSIRLHACMSCPVINDLVDDALQNASPRINDLLLQVADVAISVQSKIKYVQVRWLRKLYLQTIFECLLMTRAKNYKNWWMCVRAIAVKLWTLFFETHCIYNHVKHKNDQVQKAVSCT